MRLGGIKARFCIIAALFLILKPIFIERCSMKKKLILISALFALAVAMCSGIAFASETTAATDKLSDGFSVECYSAYLTDYATGAELYSQNADAKHEIASMVKIMTATLVFEAIDEGRIGYDDMITVSENASSMGGSQMFLDAHEKYSVDDLIKGVVVASANDAAVALAETVSGSVEGFVNAMNDKAAALGMVNTKFANATGLPSESEQYSTAKDVNIMTRELMKQDKYYEYASIWTEDYTHPSGRVTTLTNTNKMIRQYQGCLGGKTGYTDRAKFCVSACAERNGIKTVATVIGAEDSKTRFAGACKMFNYAFANFRNQVVCKKGEKIEESVAVERSRVKTMTPVAATDASVLIKQGDDIKVEYELPEKIKAPVKKGDVVGKIKITHNGKIYTFDLVSDQDISRATLWDIIKDMAGKW